jgi:hypothetical protein
VNYACNNAVGKVKVVDRTSISVSEHKVIKKLSCSLPCSLKFTAFHMTTCHLEFFSYISGQPRTILVLIVIKLVRILAINLFLTQ